MDGSKIAKLIALGLFLILSSCTALGSFYTIDQGERGVILHNGAIAGEAEPGLGFKTPFITTIEHISVQVQKDAFEKGTNDGAAYDNRMQAYSRDQQPATIALSINYHVTDVSKVYSQYGTLQGLENRLINPKAYEQLKNVFGQFNAVEAIQNRAKLNVEVLNAISNSIKGPLSIDSVQVEDISFSDNYEKAVEARMQATVQQQQAEAEKQKRIINADAAAYEVKASADAKAHQIEVQGAAEATAIKARADALRSNPDLVALTAAEKWNGTLPTTMVPNGALPFVNLK